MKLISIILSVFFFNYLNICLLNILQKQYYNIKRLIIYLKQHIYIYLQLLIIVGLIVLISFQLSNIACFLSILFFLFPFKNKIIKFRFTKRIIRSLIISNIIIIPLSHLPIYTAVILFYPSFIIIYYMIYFIEYLIQYKNILSARKKLSLFKGKIIAITGSYGKTTTKHFIYELLSGYYNVCMSKNSFNTFNGILLTINNDLKPNHEILLIEIGVDSKNGMNKFLKLLKIDIGIITCIGKQHLTTFKTFERIIIEKNKLLKSLSSTSFAIINIDDENIYYDNLNCTYMTTSLSKIADYTINFISNSSFRLTMKNNSYICYHNLCDGKILIDLLFAIATADYLSIPSNIILEKIPLLKNIDHRMSFKQDKNWLIIDNSYNSNLNSFLSSCDTLSKYKEFKILITPGLIETYINYNERMNLFYKIYRSCDLLCIINNTNFFKEYRYANFLNFKTFKECMKYLNHTYINDKCVLLIENDLPDIYIK